MAASRTRRRRAEIGCRGSRRPRRCGRLRAAAAGSIGGVMLFAGAARGRSSAALYLRAARARQAAAAAPAIRRRRGAADRCAAGRLQGQARRSRRPEGRWRGRRRSTPARCRPDGDRRSTPARCPRTAGAAGQRRRPAPKAPAAAGRTAARRPRRSRRPVEGQARRPARQARTGAGRPSRRSPMPRRWKPRRSRLPPTAKPGKPAPAASRAARGLLVERQGGQRLERYAKRFKPMLGGLGKSVQSVERDGTTLYRLRATRRRRCGRGGRPVRAAEDRRSSQCDAWHDDARCSSASPALC